MSDSTFITGVELYNYKSIAHCSVELRPLMFLVGLNGAGKSNFLDALRFVSEALNTSLNNAIRQRGGIRQIIRHGVPSDAGFAIRLDFRLPSGATGTYAFHLAPDQARDYRVVTEECRVRPGDDTGRETYFRVENGVVTTSESVAPPAAATRLTLVNAAGLPALRPVYENLSRMSFYNLNPDAIREGRQREAGERLTRSGDNLASVLAEMQKHSPPTKQRIEQFLAYLVPGVAGVQVEDADACARLTFQQADEDGSFALQQAASGMSDGALRALGVLAALYQSEHKTEGAIPLVGIEEPETCLHPARVGGLFGAMDAASLGKEILVITHSADLLSREEVTAEMLLAVISNAGVTRIGPIDAVSRFIIRDKLFTVEELMRQNQFLLEPDAPGENDADTLPLPKANAA